jgi:hypothetical protein
MTVSYLYPDGATNGPSGEMIVWDVLLTAGMHCEPFGMETRLSEFTRMVSHQCGASWAADPDYIVAGWRGHRAIMFGCDAKGVTALRDNPLTFSIPDKSVRGMVRFSASHGLWGVFACVAWGGMDIKIATAQQVHAQGTRNYEHDYWLFDASGCPSLDDWLDNMPPYHGGALARVPAPQPQLPSNVVQFPRAA